MESARLRKGGFGGAAVFAANKVIFKKEGRGEERRGKRQHVKMAAPVSPLVTGRRLIKAAIRPAALVLTCWAPRKG